MNMKRAVDAYRQAETVLDMTRLNLRDEIVSALKAGTSQAELVKVTGYSREQLRRIAREAGLMPGSMMDGRTDMHEDS